ncbi:MAG: hypothetical protein ABJL99_19785 [Aliishimia sp.]
MSTVLVALRRRLRLRYPIWHIIHNVLVLIAVVPTVIHAVQIDGTMGHLSKSALCNAVLIATCGTMFDICIIRPFRASRARSGLTLRE